MSNRKAHRRARSFRRAENFVQHRNRRPFRSEGFWRRMLQRQERRRERALVAELAEDPNLQPRKER